MHTMRKEILAFLVVITCLPSGSQCDAEEHGPGRKYFVFHPHAQGTPAADRPQWIPHTDERAGYPRCLAGHLEPSTTPGGIGYYVGGGARPGHGEPRSYGEGTWGWDETGCHLLRHRSLLGWYHGRRHQGGTGAYGTDGPVVPDLIYAATSTANSLHRGAEAEPHE
jgi:hypothetical protein